jgi:hypothetical protein
MKILKEIFIYILLLCLHVELLAFFALSYYFIYFINLFLVIFMLMKFRFFEISRGIFLLLSLVSIILVNTKIYDKTLFELFLSFDLIDKQIFIDSVVMYVLSLIHILVFINLKRLREILGYNS